MADEPSDFSDIDRSRKLLATSEKALSDALDALAIYRAQIEAGETVPQTELGKALLAVSQNRGRVSDDMRKHEDRILIDKKRVANAPLDFDKLRFEIGRKIDRLRATFGTGELSEEP